MSIDLGAKIASLEAKCAFPVEQALRAEKRAWLASKLPKGKIGVEIGVFRGHFSEVLAANSRPKKLYLIDPWTKLGATFGWRGPMTSNDELLTVDAKSEAKLRAMRGGVDEPIVIEGFFPECAPEISEKLDWAYLDANHKYDATLEQLRKLDSMLASQGWIAGDDWRPNTWERHHGVFHAVQEFVGSTNWKIVMCGYLSQWILRRDV